MSFLGSLTGLDAGKAIKEGIQKNMGLMDTFDKTSNNTLRLATAGGLRDWGKAINAFNPYTEAGSAATGLYGDAMGLNGEEGTARATGAFQTGPGYQFAMDQGTQAALRGASAAGMLNSGNTLTALTQFGQGLADQEYGSWLDRLQGMSSQGLQAAGGQASAWGGRSDARRGFAGDDISLDSSVLQGRMGLNNDLAAIEEQMSANKGGFFGGLLKTGLSLGGKALTGGLF